ncbi:hypothetical protein [Planomonospora algeriensis]
MDLRDSAVLVTFPPTAPLGDGRTAHLLLCDPTAVDPDRLSARLTDRQPHPGRLVRLEIDTPVHAVFLAAENTSSSGAATGPVHKSRPRPVA